MRWPEDAKGWPLSDYSRMVLHRPHRWHIQEAGTGKTILLIHGAGGATQSFRGLFPILMQTHHVVAVDLPGQGFTQSGARQRFGLQATAQDLLSLIRSQGWTPDMIVAHSAGAAIALQLVDLGLRVPRGVVGINAALGKFKGVAGWLFPMMAKVLALTPFTADLFVATATETTVRRLLEGTGSQVDDDGLRLYLRLATDRGHVDSTLAMMSQWDLDPLLARLGQMTAAVHLITGLNDLAVPPQTSRDVVLTLPNARLTEIGGLGHLAHEEAPDTIAALIRA